MPFLTRWTSFAQQSDINLKISFIRKTNKHVNRLVYTSMNDAGKGNEVALVDCAETDNL